MYLWGDTDQENGCGMDNEVSVLVRVLLNYKNEDMLYNNCGCTRDLRTHNYTNLLCMKIITSKKKFNLLHATNFGDIVHPGVSRICVEQNHCFMIYTI